VLLLATWWSVHPSLPAGAALVMPLFTAATAVALLFPLRLGQGRDMTVAAAPDFAALLLLGPAAALVTVGVGTLVANVARAWQGRRNRWDICFNTGQKIVTLAAAGVVLLVAAPSAATSPVRFDRPAVLLAILAAAAAAYLVNTGLVAVAIGLQRRGTSAPGWLAARRRDILPQATLYLLGTLAAVLAGQSPWAPLLLLLPLAMVHQALRQTSLAAAHETERLKGELLSVVSHELRTPLGTIKGYVSSLRHYGGRLDPAAQAESLQAIDDAADRLTELVNDLLDLQRLETGQVTLARDLVDLRAVVADVLAVRSNRVVGHLLEVVSEPATPPVRGDERRLGQVVGNLVDNACKYSPPGSRVSVRLGGGPAGVHLQVQDEGIGLPAAELGRVFERFYRVDSSLTREVAGTGLGLTIVRELVAAHGGSVRAESAGAGQGSTFTVLLPAATEERQGDGPPLLSRDEEPGR
jgi:signal transduction histidine kinase